ncbi:hypothetical protein HMP09_1942 [Sphingomonas sp. HMP9]|uniref:MFS transporter n=1 Tax=Sphingomonas sp. HMP9 TaxID=1517554 RepID=UPI0015965AE6|nr:MFS transporter [Sphingomonas sp. HMP9]BCA62708.1 hypothetical protein HMP09_1942 [Sphingomonas sp. HMP9]
MRLEDQAHTAGHGEWRRGWPLVVGGMIGIGTGSGLYQNLSSLFTPGMMADLHWSRGDIATAGGLGLVGGLVAPFVGRLTDRIGVRSVIVAAMLLLGIAYVGLSRISGSLWQFQGLVLCLVLAVPGTSALVYGKLISSAFTRYRGTALGIATSGQSVTTICVPPVLSLIIASAGWRGGFLALGVLTSLVALPLVLLSIRRAPSLRLVQLDRSNGSQSDTNYTGRQARRTGTFWRLAVGVMLINMGTVGLVSQLVPFGIDHGLSATQAALLLASYGSSQVAGRVVIGLLVDRFRPQTVAAGAALFSGIGFALLQLSEPGFAILMIAVFVAGIMNGAEHDLLPFFTGRLFGLRSYGEIYGTLLMLALIGTATGIIGFGRLHDATGSYGIALLISLGGMVAAAVAFLSLNAPPPVALVTIPAPDDAAHRTSVDDQATPG